MAEDNVRTEQQRLTLREEADKFVDAKFRLHPQPIAYDLAALLSRIDREAFERGKAQRVDYFNERDNWRRWAAGHCGVAPGAGSDDEGMRLAISDKLAHHKRLVEFSEAMTQEFRALGLGYHASDTPESVAATIRGWKQAAESQPAPPPQPAGKAELTDEESSELGLLVRAWEACPDADLVQDKWRSVKAFVAQLRAEAVAKVERERDEAKRETESMRSELFELRKRLGQSVREHAQAKVDLRRSEDVASYTNRAYEKVWSDRKRIASALGVEPDPSGVDAELAKIKALAAERDEARAELERVRKQSKPYTPPLTDAQSKQLAKEAWDAYEELGFSVAADERWLNVVRAIAPRIARVQLRELTEREVSDLVAEHLRQSVRVDWEGTKPFVDAILELAWTEAPSDGAVGGGS